MQRYSKFLQSTIPEKQQKCEAKYFVSCTKVSSCNNNIQARCSSKALNFLTRFHSATTSPSQLPCSIPDIIYVLWFEFFTFLSHSVLYNLNRIENYKTVSVGLLCTLNILIWYSTKVLLKMFVEFFEVTKVKGEGSAS